MKYFVIGSGIWGSVIAERIATQLNEEVIVIERRNHIGGNCHSFFEEETGIECHAYGSHIFHTSIKPVYEYLTQFCTLNAYRHKVFTRHDGLVYSMPFNLQTLNAFYKKEFTPDEASKFLKNCTDFDNLSVRDNLEEKAISLIGRPLYEAFIKNYTKKQWERDPKELPADIITRLPFRTTYNNDYFNDVWQGIPIEGYNKLFERLLSHPNIRVKLNTSYATIREQIPSDAKIIYTGMPDELFDYRYGYLEWRSLIFEWENLSIQDFQGTAVMNDADAVNAYTRTHEFKHYHPEREDFINLNKTVICREYSQTWKPGFEAYYPINDLQNDILYEKYKIDAQKIPNLILGGRLGAYRYWDMDKAIANALETFDIRIAQQESDKII